MARNQRSGESGMAKSISASYHQASAGVNINQAWRHLSGGGSAQLSAIKLAANRNKHVGESVAAATAWRCGAQAALARRHVRQQRGSNRQRQHGEIHQHRKA